MAQFLIMARVPEVEPYIARLRARFDPSTQRGLGAHVTVLHSNMPSGPMDPVALEQLGATVSSLTPFDYRITRVARFPGTLYLAAEPAAPFMHLKDRLVATLLEYGCGPGDNEPLIPHVSVVRKSTIDDREVEAELQLTLQRHGPIPCACKEVVLLENSSGMWRPLREYLLSGDTGSPWQAPS